jgi:hypothetical protein
MVAFKVSPDVLSRVQDIANFDLSRVMEQHVRMSHQFPGRYTDVEDGAKRARLELDLKRYLALPLLFPNREHDLVPRLAVDLLWHAFILNTTLYRAFCDRVYGRYLDHVPAANRAKRLKEDEGRPLEHTLESLNLAFGGYDPDSWQVPAICSCNFG